MLFSFQSPVFPLRFAFPPFEGGEGGMFLCVRSFVIQSVSEESPFCHFWLDSKVTQRSRLRALHTPSRCLQVGKSGNSLRFGQPDFLSPCSLLRRLTARGPSTNAPAFACFPNASLHIGLNERALSGLCQFSSSTKLLTARFAKGGGRRARPFPSQLVVIESQPLLSAVLCARHRNPRADVRRESYPWMP